MTFDPRAHLIKLPKRTKDPETGKWITVMQDYLEVRYRVQHFREQFPHGHILTEEVCVDVDRGYARFKAIVEDGEGGMASAYGTEVKASFEDYMEKASTRAVGRALALLGFGTPFSGEDLDESTHVADSPVMGNPITEEHQALTTTPAVATPTATPGPPPTPEPTGHPNEAELATLRGIALGDCLEDPEAFADRIRRTMGLKPDASVAPKLLTRTMSRQHYATVLSYYQTVQAQLAHKTTPEVPHEPVPETQPTPQPAPTATAEGAPAVPSPGLSSAPEPDPAAEATERDRQRLRQEVKAWNLGHVSAAEIERTIQKHPYSRARHILWAAAHPTTKTPLESAAD
jgi:hypothetical protein